jgi:hypothetical protein
MECSFTQCIIMDRKIYSLDRAFEYLQPSELEKMTGRGRDDFLKDLKRKLSK